jgi:hypothetical protein
MLPSPLCAAFTTSLLLHWCSWKQGLKVATILVVPVPGNDLEAACAAALEHVHTINLATAKLVGKGYMDTMVRWHAMQQAGQKTLDPPLEQGHVSDQLGAGWVLLASVEARALSSLGSQKSLCICAPAAVGHFRACNFRICCSSTLRMRKSTPSLTWLRAAPHLSRAPCCATLPTRSTCP